MAQDGNKGRGARRRAEKLEAGAQSVGARGLLSRREMFFGLAGAGVGAVGGLWKASGKHGFGGGSSLGEVDNVVFEDGNVDPVDAYNQFLDFVVQNSRDRLVMVDFFADWCPPCHELTPNLIPGAEASGEDILIVKAEVQGRRYDQPTNLFLLQDLMRTDSFPEMQIYREGILIDHRSGVHEPEEIAEFIRGAAQFVRNNQHDLAGAAMKKYSDLEVEAFDL